MESSAARPALRRAASIAASTSATLEGIVYGVRPTDGGSFLVVGAVLTAAALLACWLPAARASKVDPAVILRSE